LLDAIKITGIIPANQMLLTDERILSFCNEEIESKILPSIQSMNQDYLTTSELIPLVAGQDTYSIPRRALGRTMRDLKLVDEAGNTRNMLLVNLEGAGGYTGSSYPSAFYFLGDKFVINAPPSASSNYTLKAYYFGRPGRLVPGSYCSQILGISTDGVSFTTFTVNNVPAAFGPGYLCDLIEGISGNSTVAKDLPIANIAGNQITFSAVIPTMTAGDYIAPQYMSPVLQFPEEGFSLLVALAGERCLRALGDLESAESLAKLIPEKRNFFESMLTPRVVGESIKVMHPNGLLRGRYFRTRGL
jgi:hypothetical protein